MPIAPDQIARYREILLDKREALLGQVASLDGVVTDSTRATETSRSPLSIAENASDAYESDFAFISMESEESLLRKIEEALQHIRDGSYGQCADCGDEISSERLEALPFANLCVKCQQEEERRHSGRRGEDGDGFGLLEEEVAESPSGDDHV
jgi:RNA polymerase-binding protein DksA